MLRKQKKKTAQAVRQVKKGLDYQVKIGILSKKEARFTMLNIGKRMKKPMPQHLAWDDWAKGRKKGGKK